MELLYRLQILKERMFIDSGHCLTYNVVIEDGGILVKYCTYLGWNPSTHKNFVYNSCDWETNVNSFRELVISLEKEWGC
jgi:hypothetical protein